MNSRRTSLSNRMLYWLGWIGPLLYLGCGLGMGWLALRSIPNTPMPNQLMAWGILAFGLGCLRQAYKEFLEARADELLYSPPDPDGPASPRWRHPLTPELRDQLLSRLVLLETAGILDPGEVSDDEVIECAEHTDVFEDIDSHAVVMILESLADVRDPPLNHFAFFTNQVEFYDDDTFEIVREFARISGYDGPLRQIRFDTTDDCQRPSLDPTPNAVIEFETGTARYSLPFTVYAKYLPDGLIEQLAPIFSPSDRAERFYISWDSMNLDVTYTTPAQIAEFNAAIGPEPSWVEIK
ncbi:hypothetical protein H7J71_06965 [Mycolicibacterium peregrinum]|uniref:hypothetical protein n=1 Tax=Mycolicibacterium peregrinum TaxID=43304 RepID=UPI0006D81ED8|nr:hypothetical protein [Mycolicibacterium peregrinum]MCV7201754.1 hypothetical protein [Mycolicibacterium peregrinum]ORW61648.1 hypothetical protein AWC21_06790 [Mycolicibacterium peregrinum]